MKELQEKDPWTPTVGDEVLWVMQYQDKGIQRSPRTAIIKEVFGDRTVLIKPNGERVRRVSVDVLEPL